MKKINCYQRLFDTFKHLSFDTKVYTKFTDFFFTNLQGMSKNIVQRVNIFISFIKIPSLLLISKKIRKSSLFWAQFLLNKRLRTEAGFFIKYFSFAPKLSILEPIQNMFYLFWWVGLFHMQKWRPKTETNSKVFNMFKNCFSRHNFETRWCCTRSRPELFRLCDQADHRHS